MSMKTKLTTLALAVTALVPSLRAQLNIPNADGSDGALIIGTNTVIDLSKAVSGGWTSTSASPGNPGNGTYDPAQWAVVFKYSSVIISNGATLSFLNHITHAPVVWLVSGNVTISGAISLDGQAGNTDPANLTEPGPGGFRGGGGPTFGRGPGFGPGGGSAPTYAGTYGNPQIIPLIGGSGGNGTGYNGNGGGGAMLIAAGGILNLTNGYLHSTGGYNNNGSAPASGGAIRLVASQIACNNSAVTASGGGGSFNYNQGGNGIIRLEANSVIGTPTIIPYVQAVAPANPPVIFPDASAASVSVLSVSNLTAYLPAPANPKATMTVSPNSDDFTLVTTNAVTIRLQTLNFPTNGSVVVFINPRNSSQTTVNAALVSGNSNSALWQVSNVLLPNPAHTVIQARAAY